MTGLGCMQDAANRGSIETVQIKGPNSNWETLNNIWGASWEIGQSPQPPLDIRIQDDQGIDVGLLIPLKKRGSLCHALLHLFTKSLHSKESPYMA